jgi:phage gp36-like protein
MRYLTLADLEKIIAKRSLIELSCDYEAADEPDMEVISNLAEGAEDVIDSYVGQRYALPLDPVPSLLRGIAAQWVRHDLYGRRPEGGELPDAVVRGQRDAMKMLEAIRDGKLKLGVGDDEAAATASGSVRVRTAKRRFGPGVMERY